MLTIESSITIDRSPADVFDYAADARNHRTWNVNAQSVEKISPGPIGRGTRFHGIYKGYGELEFELIEYERPTRFVMTSSTKAADFRHAFICEPVPGGMRLTQVGEVKPKGLMKLMAPMMNMMIKGQFRTNGANLKRTLEQVEARRVTGDAPTSA